MIKIRRWIIRRNIGVILLAVSLCLVFTKALFSTYTTQEEMILEGNVYYLQYAIFTKEDVMLDAVKKLDNYFIIHLDNKYYVNVGAYLTLSNAKKYQKILEENKIYTYIKNDYINSDRKEKIKKWDSDFKKEKDTLKLREINNQIINIFKE